MNKHLFTVVFLLGAIAIVWVGVGFIDSSFLALLMTIIIGAVYAFGALELREFRRTNSTLTSALTTVSEDLTDIGGWLNHLPSSLQNAVRLRIEGERVSLPGPTLTPYLVGLLVMLGMLGTFLGMVVTLKGAVFALEKTADLQAMRSALAVPVNGLGLAFGTSVAGVAASAMLGLMSALSRRERTIAVQLLDTKIATVLRHFSHTYQRQETFKALQLQSQALPVVVDKLESMMAHMENVSQQLNQRLLNNQESFHSNVKGVYTDLARTVDKSLRDNISQSAQIAGENIKSTVEVAMTQLAHEAKAMHERISDSVQLQLDGLSERFNVTTTSVANHWTSALKTQEQTNTNVIASLSQSLAAFNASFEQRADSLVTKIGNTYIQQQTNHTAQEQQQQQAWTQSLATMASSLTHEWKQTSIQTLSQQQQICDAINETMQEISKQTQANTDDALAQTTRLISAAEELMRSRIAAEAQWIEQHRERMHELTHQLRTELSTLNDKEAARGNAAVERLGELQAALANHLTTLGNALEQPITRLIETASEAPRAAAEVIAQLREQISSNVSRDNALLEERSRIMETLNTLLHSINQATLDQHAVIESLTSASATALNTTASTVSENVTAEVTKLSDIAAHITGSAVEVSSLSEAFSFAVNAFNEANEKLISNLQRIEDAMSKSLSRSDEQMAYYVAQAREIIDLSMMSQKEIVEELRQLPTNQTMFAERAN